MPEPSLIISWDPAKDESNRRKHGISFREAGLVFVDPLAQSEYDNRYDGRWRTIGQIDSDVVVVAHGYEEDVEHGQAVVKVRIISARFATPAEIRAYRDVTR
jgi:uncharacterized DUF497 family protein